MIESGRYRHYKGGEYSVLGEAFADPVAPADFPELILRFRNDRAAHVVGLDGLDDEAWLRHFGRFEPLPDNQSTPLAMRYHGHQFRVYNPELGDGRGFLFAQMRGGDGRLMDLGTKGSGTTPWSRSGDGRLTLKGVVREILATEMLEGLGVNTSKTFSVIDLYFAFMAYWRPGRSWHEANAPRLFAIAQKAAARPRIGKLIEGHMG